MIFPFRDNFEMPPFSHHDLQLLNASFDSPLVDVLAELEFLRRRRLEGDTDRVPGSGVTEPAEGALRAKEDGHRGSWLTLSLRRPNTHQRNHDDQAHYRIDRVG